MSKESILVPEKEGMDLGNLHKAIKYSLLSHLKGLCMYNVASNFISVIKVFDALN